MPPPSENFNVYVRYSTAKGQREWKDLFYEINSAHQNNRLGGNEFITLAFSNALRHYVGNAPKNNLVIDIDKARLDFIILSKMIHSYLEKLETDSINYTELIITVRPIDSPSYSHKR